MGYPITIDNFSGPLDLLLHVIEQNQVSINDICLVEITTQYLNYLRAAQEFDLELASEFLLVGATLLRLKISTLLPKDSGQDQEHLETEGGQVIPETGESLIRRLAEYKEFKRAAAELAERMEARMHVFLGNNRNFAAKGKLNEDLLPEITLEELARLASDVFRRGQNNGKQKLVPGLQEVSLGQVVDWVRQVLGHCHRRTRFSWLIKGLALRQRIAVFVSLLEMGSKRLVTLEQEHLFGDFWIAKVKPSARGDSELALRSH